MERTERVEAGYTFECDIAVSWAREYVDGRAMQLWYGDTMTATIPPDRMTVTKKEQAVHLTFFLTADEYKTCVTAGMRNGLDFTDPNIGVCPVPLSD